ncbi:L-seryl-tRNA(Sec) selenium transferase [Aquibacillus salsiterrae]|uniref:L-seryl-tRNA(Sec) selenium transferase n=1 Tax=Aquibacillus salsiterrae TaxID=2950439 RepID=A0A9X3WG09_9BACI|nr:L-seryl-tRNA(Sec) selenium transferase [Aquibacillus salsiterrae]MDC3417978.1 L-seryl-tRNA(Sec) selenium transferase [Aquibacillus salsiterrae]
MKHLLREIPPVHELQVSDKFQQVMKKFDQPAQNITKIIQNQINAIREELIQETLSKQLFNNYSLIDIIWQRVDGQLADFAQEKITNVINATGTVLHTNLGRARLSNQAIDHIVKVARGYSNLEYNLKEGKRGSRHDIIEGLLKEATGAEAAMVVNNNAAAVYLILRALAKEKEVIVSRGQLVEIGGSFRVSSIMEESGAHLVEVGTTNKTHLYDYEQAITEDTRMILKVHTSNFKTIGFTESVETDSLVSLANQHQQLIVYEDLGSGSLFDFKSVRIGDEPVVREIINSGVDLVSFSGDKLLGGPQAGIIAGKKEWIAQLKKHQLARVLRVDKMTLAGLETTLRTYLAGGAEEHLPTIRDIIKSREIMEDQANQFVHQLNHDLLDLQIEESFSQVGGGTMPDVEVPTVLVTIISKGITAQQLANRLRQHVPPIVVRIKDDKVVVDFRTIELREMEDLVAGFLDVVTKNNVTNETT